MSDHTLVFFWHLDNFDEIILINFLSSSIDHPELSIKKESPNFKFLFTKEDNECINHWNERIQLLPIIAEILSSFSA